LDLELVVLDRRLEATTKKRSSAFVRKKVHSTDKILAMPVDELITF